MPRHPAGRLNLDKLSGPQQRILMNALLHDDITWHCKSSSDYGGLHKTIMWGVRAGLFEWKLVRPHGHVPALTAEGRAVALTVNELRIARRLGNATT